MTAYDDSNIFAKMLRGEIRAHKVFEDDDVLAVMDIFPRSRGHVLIIPKRQSRTLLDADPAALSAIMPTLQRIARAVVAATKADGLRLVQNSEAPAGQDVFHLHFHLIPAYAGNDLGAHSGGRADDADLAALAKEIAANL